MSTLSVDTIQGQTTAANVKLPAGCVLQTLSTTKTDAFSTSATGPIDITGLSVVITPKYATSKIFIMFTVHIVGYDSGTGIRLLRGSTALALGDTSGSRARMTAIGFYSNGASPNTYSGGNTSMSFLDSPATTSATTYKLQAQCLSTNGIVVNKTRYDTDNGNASRGSSTITVMEIAQ
tara:strand:+ start:5349 stop:5882 length:534 start_codon:yes stop_codon:yes gene_type:complete